MRRLRSLFLYGGATAAAVALTCCGGDTKSTTPTNTSTVSTTTTIAATPVSSYVTGFQSSSGTSASFVPGSAPAPSGGPSITVTANSTVINGGADVARIQSNTPFVTLNLSVFFGLPTAAGIPMAGRPSLAPRDVTAGFYQLRLPTPTTDTFVVTTLGRSLPMNSFTLRFSAADAGGAVGAAADSAKTVNTSASTGAVQVSLSWNQLSDVDLHVVDPNSEEIYWDNPRSTSGGVLDLDSNAACVVDRVNNENIRWSSAPAGTSAVRVDYWASCGVSQTDYAVVVNSGGSSQVFSGTFSGDGDLGAAGAGQLITTFTVTGGASAPADFGFTAPGFVPSPIKVQMAGQRAR